MKSMIKTHWRKAAIFLAGFANLFSVAYGAATVTEPTGIITKPADVQNLLCDVFAWMFWGLIVLSVIFFLIGGYLYVTSSGDAEKVSKANKTLLYAAIGVVVALVAGGVPPLIGTFFHVTGLNVCNL